MGAKYKEIKVGDLICYNAAGQRKKTMGLVFDIRRGDTDRWSRDPRDHVLVQWCVVGDVLPRPSAPRGEGHSWEKIREGAFAWHDLEHYFEGIDEG